MSELPVEVINVLLPTFTNEKKKEVNKFLQKQDFDVDNAYTSIYIITKLYEYCPNLIFVFDEKCDCHDYEIVSSISSEQIFDISVMGINHSEGCKSVLIKDMILNIVENIGKIKEPHIVTNDSFINLIIEKNEKLTRFILKANYKVLSLKNIRKRKLKNINSK